ncbi:uncharacterized protein LOC118647973 [Monomorium pharaonis]|uniref:uncharacterized protein LOC118646517 n=1 Tax=Monomorium pharaonis TaxID=307658 RepID=UPI001747A010|nr:uncharacterized protein LOC118646517 [Monomorium pharaonis]XP_036150040.1 uncharacterized protein LOC118647973 [Monomorium pharaonis]
MDDKTCDLLREWGFEDYIDIFKANEIDYTALKIMKPSDFQTIIPKIGPRIKFCDKLDHYKADLLTQQLISSQASSLINDISTENDSLNPPIVISDNNDVYDTDNTVIKETVLNVITLNEEGGEQTEEIHSTTNVITQLCDTDLDAKAAKTVLNSTCSYKQKDAARSKLCLAIIKNELKENENKRVSHRRWQELALQIQDAIPGEIQETYYIPYKKHSDKKVNAKGKLYDKYTNYVKELRKSGLRQKISNSTNNEPVVTLNDDLSRMLE